MTVCLTKGVPQCLRPKTLILWFQCQELLNLYDDGDCLYLMNVFLTRTHPTGPPEHLWVQISPFSWGGPLSLPFGRQ